MRASFLTPVEANEVQATVDVTNFAEQRGYAESKEYERNGKFGYYRKPEQIVRTCRNSRT
jgi:hypothetical protein